MLDILAPGYPTERSCWKILLDICAGKSCYYALAVLKVLLEIPAGHLCWKTLLLALCSAVGLAGRSCWRSVLENAAPSPLLC